MKALDVEKNSDDLVCEIKFFKDLDLYLYLRSYYLQTCNINLFKEI